MRFFKVTNKNECHNGFQYRDGLNIDPVSFADTGSCVPGGLYFTDAANIASYYEFGVWVREVKLPMEHPKFRMVKDPCWPSKWRASCIVLGERYSLGDPHACQALGIPLLSMDLASIRGHATVLESWKSSGSKLNYSYDAMNYASLRNQISILDWWRNSGLELLYDEDAIDWASEQGHVGVLEWWKKSGLELKYSNDAIDMASKLGHVAVLTWWRKSGLT